MKFSYFLITIALIPLFANAASEKPSEKKSLSFEADLILKINANSETIPYSVYSTWIIPQTSLSLNPNYKSEIENITSCPETKKLFCELYLSRKQRTHLQISSQSVFSEDALKRYLEDLARKNNTDPTDATFTVENGQVTTFATEQDGYKLNIEKSIPLISELFINSQPLTETKTLDLPFEKTKPNITTGEINNLGISTLIGEGTSNFKGSPANRIHNIKVATNRFNGILIKPGEEFSFVKILGEVDAEHGYLPELVIKQGVTEPEFGGGICQVSSTTFRAAIYSGLKITTRRNHAYPVSYYNPQGMDATVYVPQPDLKFKNNTPGYILIQTKIAGTILTFDFYGTDDGRKTTIDGPNIIERQPDGALKATFTQHVFDKDNNEFIKDIFNSSYASPYKYPHPGGPVLNAKPSNWTEDEWKAYKKTIKDMNKALATAAKKP